MRSDFFFPMLGVLASCSGAVTKEPSNSKTERTSITKLEKDSPHSPSAEPSTIPPSDAADSEAVTNLDEKPSSVSAVHVEPKVARGVIFLGATKIADGSEASWRKISNIMSLFAGQDPYFHNLPVGTLLTKTGWQYTRDPEKTITLTVTLKAFERTVEGTERNRWWQIISQKVSGSTGSWSPGDVFAKNSRDGNGDQWTFNYRVTDTD